MWTFPNYVTISFPSEGALPLITFIILLFFVVIVVMV